MGKPHLMGGKTEDAIYTNTNNKEGIKLIEEGWDFPADFKGEYFEAGFNYVINLVKGSKTIKVNVKNEEDSRKRKI